jgi:maltooligosyltrehalose trehalohydrolase
MSRISVWAPFPNKVECFDGRMRHPMTREPNGWWHAEVSGISDYGFVLDDAHPALPDPRSPWQPNGVHGLSRLVDHSTFRWTDQQWQAPPLSSAIIYELHIPTFSPEGTFDGAAARLGHLVELGVTHVELMPVAQFPGNYGWGYDGVDLYAPHQSYGGPDGLKRLVDRCHQLGLAVLLDVVYNHLGPAGNYLNRFGPYLTSRYATPWGEAVNLDGPDSDEVRRLIVDNAIMWLRDYRFDGLRLDAVHALIDNSATHLLEELSVAVDNLEAQLARHLVLIAESDLNDPRVVRRRESAGLGIDAQWSDDFHHALHAVLTGERSGYYADFGCLDHLAKALSRVFVYDGKYSAFRRRTHGRPAIGLNGHSFLGYAQNHDQIGNRATGDRLSHLTSRGLAKIAAGLVLTSPFVPMLFQGEEWAASTPFQYFTDHEDPRLGHAVSEGRKNEFVFFGWDPAEVPDPQSRETFERSKLNWSERDDPSHQEMLDWHRSLIRLRRAHSCLSDGDLDSVSVRFDKAAGWMAVSRGPLDIVCNFSGRHQCIPLEARDRPALLLQSDASVSLNECGVGMGAETFCVVGPERT